MILHIVPDEKFIDMAYSIFEEVKPNGNEFIVVSQYKNLKYIKSTPIKSITPQELLSKRFINRLNTYEFVMLHCLDFIKKMLVKKADNNVKFLWIGWGIDYYNYIFPKQDLLLPITNNFVNKKINISNFIKKIIKFFLLDDKKILNKIDYFAPVLENEYKLVFKSLNKFTPKFIDWNYGSLEHFITGYENFIINGNNILLGNSDTATNNHFEIINKLSYLNIKSRQVIIPLSYGNINYRDKVIKYAESKSLNFRALTEFMDINKYNEIISSCSIVIMNHLRQQALANIIVMMYFGAKIFLNSENPIYSFFKSQGAIIFSIDIVNNETINSKLTMDEININREILKKYWSKNIILKKTAVLIEEMNKKN